MRPQLIIDCGSRVLSALLVLPDGETVPVSQEIRNVATRHVSSDVLFDPRVPEHPDFVWEDAIESLARARPRDFFQRARRIGLRRPWDAHASADLLRLASPMAVLSSSAALADRVASQALPHFSLALIDALLEPAFAFVADRKLTANEIDPVLIVQPRAGRAVRSGLHKLVRRRGFGRPMIVNREVAAALSLLDQSCNECVVVDSTDDDLHVHRITFIGAPERLVRSVRSSTLRGLGWSHWVSRIALALGTTPSPSFDRLLLALLTGSPDALPSPLTHAALQAALDETWVETERRTWTPRLRGQFDAVGIGADAQLLLVGEIFALDGLRRVFGSSSASGPLDLPARGVAAAMRWSFAEPSRTLQLASAGSVRLDTLHGEALPLLESFQLPAAGELCHLEREFRFAGEPSGDAAFLVHLLWGTDSVPEGNATLSAIPIRRHGSDELHMTVRLRRSRSGAVLSGTVAVSAGRDTVTARFTQEVEVKR
jgi:hypothetical protein